jgi:AmmeMemoRadiSam system protein A
MLTEQQKKKILGLARETLKCYLSGKEVPAIPEDDPVLQEKRGIFVTLKRGGELRGCIGYIQPIKPLAEAVRDISIQSATADPRFPAVSHEELKEISIEVSVLTVPKKVDAKDVSLGRDGVIVKKGYRQGVFLPQVADETGWTKEEFLNNLCLHKAGLPPDSWKKPDTEIYTFHAEVFAED